MTWAGQLTWAVTLNPRFFRLLGVSHELLETNERANLLENLESKAEPSGSETKTQF